MSEKREYAQGTHLTVSYPFAFYLGGRAMCGDGIVRNLKRISVCADTFFSIPASVTVKGKTVAGYVSVETVSGSSVETNDDPAIVVFHAYTYRKNGGLLP